jgi:hypothetical protein
MHSYLVERYLPGLSEAELRSSLRRLQPACDQVSARGAGVRYRGSMFLPLEETCFCWFDSDRRETAAEVNDLVRIPFARITEVVVMTPGGEEPRGRESVAPSRDPVCNPAADLVDGGIKAAPGGTGSISVPQSA